MVLPRACSISRLILPPPGGPVHPRTALRIDASGWYLQLVVVDGRQPGYSEGLALRELLEFMLELGCQDAVNLDGGGSSILLWALPDGGYRVANDPATKVQGRSTARPIPVGFVVTRR